MTIVLLYAQKSKLPETLAGVRLQPTDEDESAGETRRSAFSYNFSAADIAALRQQVGEDVTLTIFDSGLPDDWKRPAKPARLGR